MTIETVKILRESADTYEERNKVYGDNFLKVGAIMSALFPDGLTVKTPDDWNRLHILVLGVVKQTRYVQNWASGGHRDSIHDNTVYSAMLEAIDAEIASRPEPVDYEGAIARMEVLLKDLEEARDYAKGWSDRAKIAGEAS
jgi:hypothetical protein